MAVMKYFYELTISSSPHVHSPITTQTIMRDVLIALAPAMVGSVVFFGARALTVTLVSVLACVFFEWAYCRLMHKHCKVYDLSAAVTGVNVYLLIFFKSSSVHSNGDTLANFWITPGIASGSFSSIHNLSFAIVLTSSLVIFARIFRRIFFRSIRSILRSG